MMRQAKYSSATFFVNQGILSVRPRQVIRERFRDVLKNERVSNEGEEEH